MYFEDFIIDLAVINHIFFRITTKLAKRLCEEGMNLNIVIKGRKLIIFFKINLVSIFLFIIIGMIKDIQKEIDSMFYKLHYEKINDEKNDLVNKKTRFNMQNL